MNERFFKHCRASGMSMYKLAKVSGVPYTTLSRLKTGKQCINSCSCMSVMKIAAVLHVSIEDIMDPVFLMDGVSGKAAGIPYVWKEMDGTIHVLFHHQGKDVCLDTGDKLQIPERREFFDTIGDWAVEGYIDELRLQEEMDRIWKEKYADGK